MSWLPKIECCLSSLHCRPSQRQFLLSVRSQIERFGEGTFPTPAQRSVLNNIIRHVEKLELADVLGDAVDCL